MIIICYIETQRTVLIPVFGKFLQVFMFVSH